MFSRGYDATPVWLSGEQGVASRAVRDFREGSQGLRREGSQGFGRWGAGAGVRFGRDAAAAPVPDRVGW